jgi:hypothetical protein
MTGAFSTIVLEAPGQLSLYPGQLLSSLIAGACVESNICSLWYNWNTVELTVTLNNKQILNFISKQVLGKEF